MFILYAAHNEWGPGWIIAALFGIIVLSFYVLLPICLAFDKEYDDLADKDESKSEELVDKEIDINKLQVGKIYTLFYKDAYENETQREIIVLDFEEYGERTYIQAKVGDGEHRTFRVDRIQSMFCAETGEQI